MMQDDLPSASAPKQQQPIVAKKISIRYFTFTISGVQRRISSIFGIPFYRSSGMNSQCHDTWFPFLGLQPHPDGTSAIRSWFRKPSAFQTLDLDTEFDPEIAANFDFRGDDILRRFRTTKCLLISALLGGGIWNGSTGSTLLVRLKEKYPDFFKYYIFDSFQDTLLNFIPENQGFIVNSTECVAQLVQINSLLSAASGKDLSHNFAAAAWQEILSDLRPLLTPKNRICTLPAIQTTIENYFSPPRAATLHNIKKDSYATAFNPDQLFIPAEDDLLVKLGITLAEYGELLAAIKIRMKLNPGYWQPYLKSNIGYFPKIGKVKMIIYYCGNQEIFIRAEGETGQIHKGSQSTLWHAYDVTAGRWIIARQCSDMTANMLEPLFAAQSLPNILPIYGAMNHNDNGKTLFAERCDITLLELLINHKVSHEVKKQLFLQTLQAIASFHRITFNTPPFTSKAYCGDIKPSNFMLKFTGITHDFTQPGQEIQPGSFQVYLTDLDTTIKINGYSYTTGYLPPELAFLSHSEFKSDMKYIQRRNLQFGRASDIWNLGLTLAKLLQEDCQAPRFDSEMPNLYFILNRYDTSRTLHSEHYASIFQHEIDDELVAIKAKIDTSNPAGRELLGMWKIVHSMLQVDATVRPSATTLVHNARVILLRPTPKATIYRQLTLEQSLARQRKSEAQQRALTHPQRKTPIYRQATLEQYFALQPARRSDPSTTLDRDLKRLKL